MFVASLVKIIRIAFSLKMGTVTHAFTFVIVYFELMVPLTNTFMKISKFKFVYRIANVRKNEIAV